MITRHLAALVLICFLSPNGFSQSVVTDEVALTAPLVATGSITADSTDSGQAISSAETLSATDQQLQASLQWLVDLALAKLPPSYRGEKDWGDQKRLWAGVKIRRDGLRLRTHRRFREVNHGRWIEYEIFPRGRDSSATATPLPVKLQITAVRQTDSGWEIDSSATVEADFVARVQRWNLGVKLFSVTLRGDLRVRLDSTVTVAFLPDYGELPPALVIDPTVQQASLTLERFEVNRISHLGGDVAEELGEVVERVIQRVWLARLNDKLVGKLNRSIDKNRDDLRFSLEKYLTGWK